jgi:hypothetical protein
MAIGGTIPAEGNCGVRLDPMTLPVRFSAFDGGADGRVRLVEVHRERVVLRRAVRGIRMAVSVPLASFLGVAIRIMPPSAETDGAFAVVLEHRDPALSIPVFVAPDGADVIAEWQLWARMLGRPLLVADAGGGLREPFHRLGKLHVGTVAARRRRQGAVHMRRPVIQFRRRPTRIGTVRIHCGEREIIARN